MSRATEPARAASRPPVRPDAAAGVGRRWSSTWSSHTLRTRVTLVVMAGSSLLLLVALGLLYAGLNAQLHAAVDDGLRARLQDVAAAGRSTHAAPVADPYAQIVTAGGDLVAASPSAPSASVLTPSELAEARRGLVMLDRAAPGLAGPARLAATAVPGTDRVAVVGTSLAQVDETNDRLLRMLSIVLPLLVLVLVLGVRWAVRSSLRPVASLTSQAARISTAGSSARLPRPPGQDEIAELADTLNAMLDRLETSFERERAFVDDASHEIRTPIAVLRGELELALLEDDPAATRRAVEVAHLEAQHLSRLAVDLLLLARQRAGGLQLDRTPADLHLVAERSLARLRPLLGAELRVEGAPTEAEVDVDRVDQLLTNLVTNAAEAGAQHVRVRVATRDDHAVLEVEDDGPGFPEDLVASAFDRFTRADRARTRRTASTAQTTGAGLGLAIVAAIVRGHGGDITISSAAPGGGARVTVELPRVATD